MEDALRHELPKGNIGGVLSFAYDIVRDAKRKVFRELDRLQCVRDSLKARITELPGEHIDRSVFKEVAVKGEPSDDSLSELINPFENLRYEIPSDDSTEEESSTTALDVSRGKRPAAHMENGESEFRIKHGAMPCFAMILEEQAIFNQTAVIMHQLIMEEDQPSLSASFFNTWRYFRGAIYNVSEERFHQIYIKYWNIYECEVYQSRAVEPRLGNGTVSALMVTNPAEIVPDWPKMAANTNNFYVDQLDAILRFWGSENGHDPQLDCDQSDTRAFLVPGASRPDTTVTWISSTGSTACEGEQIRHYEGIRGLEKPRNSKDHAELINPFEDPEYEIDDDPHTRGILSIPFHTTTQVEKDVFQKMEDITCLLEDEANRLAQASSLSPYFFNTWRHFEGEIVGLPERQVVEYHHFEPDCGCAVCQYCAIEPRPRIVPIRTPVVNDPGTTGDWPQATAEMSWIDTD